MRRAEKAARIAAILDRLHPAPSVPLVHDDPFTLLVSVVLSAQCTDARVNEVTPGLFALARTPEAMARLPVAAIERRIARCGLAPTKARSLKALSRILVERFGGSVPDDLGALESLPGVGHKTASVVLVQAFGRPAFPVDTHVHRLAARFGLSSGRSVAHTERDLKRLFPPEAWGRVHLQLVHFGRAHCPARGHDPAACPICSWAAPRAQRARPQGRAGSAAKGSTARQAGASRTSRPGPARSRRKRSVPATSSSSAGIAGTGSSKGRVKSS
jgi:endonuclease-3